MYDSRSSSLCFIPSYIIPGILLFHAARHKRFPVRDALQFISISWIGKLLIIQEGATFLNKVAYCQPY